jgi:predicted metal-binding membrane protein
MNTRDNGAAMRTAGSARWSAGLALAGLGGVAGAAWLYLVAGAGPGTAMRGMGAAGVGMTAMAPMARGWTPGYTALMLGIWTVMMTAMMLPSSALAVLRVAGPAGRGSCDTAGSIGRAACFAAGYLLIWAAFGAAATGLQWALDSARLLTDVMTLRNAALAGLIVVAVGIYQLTPLKRACLNRCRALDECLVGGQPRGPLHTVGQGLRYGISCLGCCAALMSLLFVGGVMNMVWAAVIAAWVLGEKVLPWGSRFALLGGIALIVGGTGALAIALARG